jgi:large subunit ribosomal protein L35
MPKNKPNKGLLKRIRITKSGRIKTTRAGGRHRRSHKSGKLRRSYRLNVYASSPEARRASALLFIPARASRTEGPAAEKPAEGSDT